MQRPFSKSLFSNGLIFAAPIMAFAFWLNQQSNRPTLPDVTVAGLASEIAAPATRLDVRVWRLTVPEPRFGGLSALAHDEGELVALTDSGVVLRFKPPVATSQSLDVRFHDLPAGPGDGRRKSSRDSESLLRDPLGRGWWVGYETRHSLWLFDWGFTRSLGQRWLDVDWARNKGAEALAADQMGTVFALPESGGNAVAADGGRGFAAPRGTADAARLADGRLALLVRRISVRGFV
ncbi:MAG: esterase-like activity of phytase family protein, partial [Pseudomonadota bacterium]|nr:esterase-like activity of phytase family protein [Pseudomonadota bacterium]